MRRSNSPIDPLETSIKALAAKPQLLKILALRFPNYRNIAPDARLPFEFPLTALLGRNGTNKSSILHALYGAPANQTVADFWFETSLDAIPEMRDGVKQSITHTYRNSAGQIMECIKARAPRSAADPDYWEAVKPTGVYGFGKGAKRAPPISLNVVHLDFRGELPAFDKYFYFPDPQHLKARANYARNSSSSQLRREYRKQDYLRRRSPLLKSAMEANGVALSDQELNILNYILEGDYIGGTVLRHRVFHGHEGRTIQFITQDFFGGYSEAFAGSGESAAAFLVHDVLGAPDGSLILLDEPETSLHPRAQHRMLEFLCHVTVRKNLQMVMATHSSYLAEPLPQKAIRVLERTGDGQVQIWTSYSAREALHEIATLAPGTVVAVEDSRAKHLVLSCLEVSSPAASREIRVEVRPGGTSRIFRDIQVHANSNYRGLFVLLDGDHRPTRVIPEKGCLPQGLDELKTLISELTRGPNSSGPSLQFATAEEATTYVEFLRSNVRYLPGDVPEELVWNERRVLDVIQLDSLPLGVRTESNAKERLRKAAEKAPGVDDETLYKILVADFIKRRCSAAEQLLDTIDEIRGAG